MFWYWIIYWLFILLSFTLSITVIIANEFKKNHKVAVWGLGYLALSILVPILSFFYCVGRDVHTDEFRYLFEGLVSFNFVAYLIATGYALQVYCFIVSLQKIKSIEKKA
jgi:hypothetical protein